MPQRILVIEDSPALNRLLCDALSQAGYEVSGFLDAESAIESPELKDAQVLVLDVQLPGESGLVLASRLRPTMPNLGILMLTTGSTHINRIEGYDAGADYYLPKPVSPQELIAAVESLLRRKAQSQQVNSVSVERCILSRSTFSLTKGQRSIGLSSTEVVILVALAIAPDKQLERWQIIELLSQNKEPVSRSALDVRMHRLRTKLSGFIGLEQPIVAVRGVGYRMGFDIEVT
jgi:DNA-binding response OmpR family regulator